jgi:hypothetical protein
MAFSDDINLEVDEDHDLTEADQNDLPSGFGAFHSRFHHTVSTAFRETAEANETAEPEADDPVFRKQVGDFIDATMQPRRD